MKIKSEEESALARKIYKNEVQSWKKKLGNERKENMRLEKIIKKDLEAKDTKLKEVVKERLVLEDKMNSLLDVLYGCDECGRRGFL